MRIAFKNEPHTQTWNLFFRGWRYVKLRKRCHPKVNFQQWEADKMQPNSSTHLKKTASYCVEFRKKIALFSSLVFVSKVGNLWRRTKQINRLLTHSLPPIRRNTSWFLGLLSSFKSFSSTMISQKFKFGEGIPTAISFRLGVSFAISKKLL